MDSLWMSSSSNAWPAVPFTSTACDTEVRPPPPKIEAAGVPPSASTISCTLRVHGSVTPCRQQPMLSSAQSLMRSTAAAGMSSNLSRDANAARSRVAFSSSGGWLVLMRAAAENLERCGPSDGRAVHQAPQRQAIVEVRLVLSRAVVPHQQVAHLPVMHVLELRL